MTIFNPSFLSEWTIRTKKDLLLHQGPRIKSLVNQTYQAFAKETTLVKGLVSIYRAFSVSLVNMNLKNLLRLLEYTGTGLKNN